MKVAFVNDAVQLRGIEYISAMLKKNGHEVELFIDPQLFNDGIFFFKGLKEIFNYRNMIIEGLKDYKPDLIGISVITDNYQWAKQIARQIKGEMDVPIILGGIHPTLVPERVIRNEFIDMVCLGEGEYPMLELVNSMEKNQIDYTIKNIWFKKNGNIIRNEVRPLIKNLDSLPMPDKELYYLKSPHFRALYLISAGRGCPYYCSYCCNSYVHELYKGKGKFVRWRSVDNVIQELFDAKSKYGIKSIYFTDECFGMDIEWLKSFSQKYQNKIGIGYCCVLHPSDATSEKINYLKKSGCKWIFLGIQSWDRKIREEWFNRWVSNEVMENAMRLILEAKIELVTENIIGLPGQQEEDIIRTNMIYTRLKPKRALFYWLKYFPNHAISMKAKKEGWLSESIYEDIQEGKDYERFLIKSLFVDKNKKNSDFLKVQKLLLIIDILPGSISRFLIKKKLYRFFPTMFSTAAVIVLRAMFFLDVESAWQRKIVMLRYIHFIKNKIFKRIKKSHENSIC